MMFSRVFRLFLAVLFTAGIAAGMTAASAAAADQEVSVTWPLEQGQSPLSVRRDVQEHGFFMAVLQEAEAILPAPLDESRRVALGTFLRPRVDDLVTRYTETGASMQEEPPAYVVTLEVGVNGRALKELLKSAGTFYTAGKPWSYALTLSGANPGEWQSLDVLQSVTGLRVVDAPASGGSLDVPELALRKGGDGVWQGRLAAGEEAYSGRHTELEALWLQLWSRYFGLAAVQDRVLGTVFLSVQGWSGLDDALLFDAALKELGESLDQEVLVHLSLQRSGTQGVWRIRTTDRQGLARALGGLLSGKGLSFELSETRASGRENELMREL
jgi:hypothetical protein